MKHRPNLWKACTCWSVFLAGEAVGPLSHGGRAGAGQGGTFVVGPMLRMSERALLTR